VSLISMEYSISGRRTIYPQLKIDRRKNLKSTSGELREQWAENQVTELGEEKPAKERVITAWTNRWGKVERSWWTSYARPRHKQLSSYTQSSRKQNTQC